ncbi:MAG: hypothetical protein COT18_00650 [Elusimicrobia bacterium CG08_land_8_20_14_0_20_59_10]|nr:MAG: hypothetical protein COT18_00650 [Elusimicrobia bacterium CG08_land_8_20_14_0_20_59_10]
MAVSIYAQAPAGKKETKGASAAAPAGQKAEKPPAAKPKQADADADDGAVMIDSLYDAEETGRFDDRIEMAGDEADVAGGIPSSYGACRGTMNEGGRNILVFESLDDGSLTFVQVTVGKNSVSWKLAGSIGRSAD